MNNFTFLNPTKILFGKGQVANAGAETSAIGKRALLLTGMGSVKKIGLYDKIMGSLTEAGVYVVEQSGVKANPDIGAVRRGVDLCKKENLDVALAVGGGSVIDAAKAIAAGAVYDGDPWDFLDKKVKVDNPLPLGVVLTLSATGSEMNGNFVISNQETEEKLGTYHPKLYPRFSILDPTLTFSIPPYQTACGAVDILSHVFEQYFHNVEGTALQDGFAETVMRTVIDNAPVAISSPSDYNARANLMWASTVALNGILGAGAKGDWASHMIEHELSAKYNIAHGAGLAIVFPSWMKQVYETNITRFKKFAVNVWGITPNGKSGDALALAGIKATKSFFKDTLGLAVTLGDCNIDDNRLREMAESATKEGDLGSVKPLGADDVESIYRNAL